MNRREVLLVVGGLVTAELLRKSAQAQEAPPREPAIAGTPHAAWNAKAEALMPVLHETRQEPLNIVRAEPDPSLVLRYRMAVDAPATRARETHVQEGRQFHPRFRRPSHRLLRFQAGDFRARAGRPGAAAPHVRRSAAGCRRAFLSLQGPVEQFLAAGRDHQRRLSAAAGAHGAPLRLSLREGGSAGHFAGIHGALRRCARALPSAPRAAPSRRWARLRSCGASMR